MATMKAAVIREAGGPDVLKIENLRTGILALELPFCNQLEEQYLALAKRRAGLVLKHRKLWPLMAVDSWFGHKMATIFFSRFQLRGRYQLTR